MALGPGILAPDIDQHEGVTGALRGTMLVRLTLNGNAVTSEERLLSNLNERIRDVREGPDGALWLLTDSASGRILRVAPSAK